jgi:AraC family transcriptional regulator
MGTLPEFGGKIVKSKTFGNLAVVEKRYASGEYLPRHCHEQAYISIALHGSYSEECGAVTCNCCTGQAIFHASGESHSNRFGDRGGALLNLTLFPDFLRELREVGGQPDARGICASEYGLQLAMKLRHEAFVVDDRLSALVIEGLTMELCAEIFRRHTRERNSSSDWLCQIESILRERFREPISLAELAGTVHIHPVHLARAFRMRFGRCVGDQIRRLRVEAASRELRVSRLSIAEIAVQTGFSDQSHLSRTFKRQTGMSPHQFRVAQARLGPA